MNHESVIPEHPTPPAERETPHMDRKSQKRPTPQTDGQLASIAHEPRDVAVRRLGAALRGMERQLAEARMAFAIATDELVVEQSAHRRTREQRDRLAEACKKVAPVASYWADIAECHCVSPQPIGSCLACDVSYIYLTADLALNRKEES